MENKVRMADIAEELGLSIVSVSKALSGQRGVSEETREKVLNLAEERGYTPLRSKSKTVKTPVMSGNIGILVAAHFFSENAFYSNLYRHVLMVSNEYGFSAMLELISPEAEKNCILPMMIRGNKVDGIIFMGEIDRNYIHAVERCNLPYMLLDFYDEELDADSVTSDNMAGGYKLTKHLIDKGRKEIGYVGSIHATSSIMDRFLGYTKALYSAGIPVNMDYVIEDRDESGLFIPLVLPEKMPSAFLCNSDEVAYILIKMLKQMGYKVPQDVAVVGYDDLQFAQISSPKITSYWVNMEEMGRIVVAQLVRKMKGKSSTKGNIVIAGEIVYREST
ncbi:MAG: LacI family DNA-binding transcriptional regulator [Agathobacter sp.]